MNWKDRAAQVSPLLAFAEVGTWGGESGVLDKIFSVVPHRARFGVEFGQRSIDSGTIAALIAEHGWGALYMDSKAVVAREVRPVAEGGTIVLALESITPSNINHLFQKYAVPDDLDCLVIDIDGIDYWVWEALAPRYTPSLVVIEFNAHVGYGIEASIHLDPAWTYASNRDYGASFAALVALASRKGYRLIHVHGPWNLYFLKNDLALPAELCIKSDLNADDFSLLTETVPFYETLCGPGKRPSWFAAAPPDVSRAPWQILAPAAKTRRVHVNELCIEVLADMQDGNWYQQRKTFEEQASLLYRFIRDEGFRTFVDVGANYGFISILARKASPEMKLVAIEADPRLARMIKSNFALNGLEPPEVVNAIVGDRASPSSPFSLNPTSTLDNRVRVEQWSQIRVPMHTLGEIISGPALIGKTFFKIDTQGFELQILRGMESYLSRTKDWVIKMEFAPDWLRSQGTDPHALMDHLQLRYEFAEFPERIPYGTPGIDALFTAPIRLDQHQAFLDYVVSLNKAGLGWVDLIVRPRA